MLLAELITEAVCREIARAAWNAEVFLAPDGAEADAIHNHFIRLQNRYAHLDPSIYCDVGVIKKQTPLLICYTANMANKTVHLNWDPEQQFILSDKDNYQIIMKKPKGVSASDLLSMSLIGCASHDLVEILNKQKQELRQLKVTAESTQDDDPPWRFAKSTFTIR